MIGGRLRRWALARAYEMYGLVRWRLLRPVTIGVRILLVTGDQVLLVRHSYQNEWNVPGGGVKVGETLVQAACREALEEAGAVVRAEPWLLGLYDNLRGGKSDHIALFVSEDWEWVPPSDRWEIEARVLYALDALPPDLPRALYRAVSELRKRQGALPGTRAVVRHWS